MSEAGDRLKGRVALVTAAAGAGIGRACARRLAADGASIVVTDRHEARTREVAEAIAAEFGVETLALPLDVGERDRIPEVVAAAADRFGTVDILVNNAALNNMDHLLHEMPRQQFDRIFDVDFLGAYDLCRETLPHMIEGRWGCIVNISSTAPFVGGAPGESAYAIAKAALHALTLSLTVEYARFGVRANAVATGVVWNERENLRRLMPDGYWDQVMEIVPAQRFGTPEEIAAIVSFLCSEEGSYLHGNVLQAGGGVNLGGPPQPDRWARYDL